MCTEKADTAALVSGAFPSKKAPDCIDYRDRQQGREK